MMLLWQEFSWVLVLLLVFDMYQEFFPFEVGFLLAEL